MTTSTKPTSTRRLVMWNMVTLDGYYEGSKQKDHNRTRPLRSRDTNKVKEQLSEGAELNQKI